MTQAHVFQHKSIGVQIFVFHCQTVDLAYQKFKGLVLYDSDWIYLGIKQY